MTFGAPVGVISARLNPRRRHQFKLALPENARIVWASKCLVAENLAMEVPIQIRLFIILQS